MSHRETPLMADLMPLAEEQQLHIKGKTINSELKGLTLGSMQAGQSYSAVAGHEAFVELMGEEPAYSGNRKNQYDYCRKSFEPAGLVIPVDRNGHIEYTLTESGQGRGKAIAGVALGFSLTQPELPLVRMMGDLRSHQAYGRPAHQFALLNLLSAQQDETPLSRKEILFATRMPSSTLSFIAHNLGPTGLVERPDKNHFYMPESWHESVNEFCTSVQRILDGDRQAIRCGKTALYGIIDSPEVVKSLVVKGYEASSTANSIAPDLMQSLVLESVGRGNHTAFEVAEDIAKLQRRAVAASTVRPFLKKLFEQGTLAVERARNSKLLRYEVAS